MRIENLRALRLRIPLAKPYKLAFGDVTHFDTLIVQLACGGREGFGEATILSGYTNETVEESWELVKALVPKLQGTPSEDARKGLQHVGAKAPFAATAFMTALEMAAGHPLLEIRTPTPVPLLFGINATDPEGIEREMELALAAGFRTFKIKAGFDLEPDLARVKLIQKLNKGRVRLRVDANQGFSRDDGCAFARRLDPDGIELLEQPCHAKDWDAAAAVAKVTRVPLMLDESIYTLSDIDKAADIGASFVKLKLMKFGSLTALADGLKRIRSLGMKPVLGNGVASDIGCWMEACVASSLIDNAGEMNGYLRQREALAVTPIPMRGGAMQLLAHTPPQLDAEKLRRMTVEECRSSTQTARECIS